MTKRARVLIVVISAVLLLGGATAYGVVAFNDYQKRAAAPSEVSVTEAPIAMPSGPRIMFRNTASGQGYGKVASVAIDAPDGPRGITDVACDRVAATESLLSCLHTDRGIATTFEATLYDSSWQPVRTWPLAGIPSRTRLSPDGTLVATTAFVTGHAYATVGFSTQTTIQTTTGADFGSLEEFAITVDGQPLIAPDRNIWGVTFAPDNNLIYATVGSGSTTWLMRGDLEARSLTSVAETAECPSLSPDGTRVAYKKNVSTTPVAYWAIAVRELATGAESVLPETRSVDDQIEWLDESTLLFGMPRDGTPGDYDVWAIAADGTGEAAMFIEHAWSPSVVR